MIGASGPPASASATSTASSRLTRGCLRGRTGGRGSPSSSCVEPSGATSAAATAATDTVSGAVPLLSSRLAESPLLAASSLCDANRHRKPRAVCPRPFATFEMPPAEASPSARAAPCCDAHRFSTAPLAASSCS
jgi:hypothetical protein